MRALLTIAIGMVLASGAGAEDASPQELVKQGNGQLHAGNYDQAIETYKQAAELLPDSPEIAYNQAIGHYRKGEFERAREMFITSLKTRDPDLEASAKFNLGNCAYAAALDKRENIPEALEELQSAILHYKDAIETNPDDLDARINIEMAQLLMKDLLDKQKQQQEEQDQQNAEQEDQEQDQDDQQQEQDEEQEGENEEQQQQNEQEQEQDQQQSGEQEQDQQGEEQQQGEQQQDQEEGEEQEGNPQQEQEQQAGEESQQQQQARAGEQDDQKGQERKMTREEAKRLLQLIRDKEMQRRREQARRARVKHAPVKKDW